ncbi:hypothetical protein ACIPX0_25480 [Streptomyces sp. NPDC090075]
MFATVNRDEDTEPADYPEPVPRPGAGAVETAGSPEPRGATLTEVVAFLNSPA